jgi:hypothetical protein
MEDSMSQTTIRGGGVFTAKNISDLNANFDALFATTPSGALDAGFIIVGDNTDTAAAVAMSGDVTIDDTGATAIKHSVSLTTPVLGAATGTSVVLSGDCRAATFHAGATAGVTAGPFTNVASINVIGGIVTTLTGS